MTEKEAKTKWCPMISQWNTPKRPENYVCIASDCMMWEWAEQKPDHKIEGYCGLTNK